MTNNKISKDSSDLYNKHLTTTRFATRLLSTALLTTATTMLVACGGGGSGSKGGHTNKHQSTGQTTSQNTPTTTPSLGVQPSTQPNTESASQPEPQTNTNEDTAQGQNEEDNQTQTGSHEDNTSSSDESANTTPVTDLAPVADDKPTTDVSVETDIVETNPSSPQHDTLSSSELMALNRLNLRRMECGFGSLEHDKTLYNAASNHTNYLLYMNKHSNNNFQGHSEKQVDAYSGKNNPYFTGYDIGTRLNTESNIGRQAIPIHYSYKMAGENLSFLRFNRPYKDKYDEETIAVNSVNSLLAAPYHMASMLSPYFTQVGISYGQDTLKESVSSSNGEASESFGSVLEMVLATPINKDVSPINQVLTYPCNETQGTQYELTHEAPNPFGNSRDLQKHPIGQPIYILARGNLTVSNYKMTDAAGQQIQLKALTKNNDPNNLLTESQVILLPLEALQPNQSYRVSYQVSVDGSAKQSQSIVFHTKGSDGS